MHVAISVENGRLILPPVRIRWAVVSQRVPDPSRSVALLAAILVHAAALGALLVYDVVPRSTPPESVIEASLLPQAPQTDEAPEPPPVAAWEPLIPELPLPRVALERSSTAITLPPPVAVQLQPVAPPVARVADALPMLDAQAVGYLVPPAPHYPPASRRLREEGEVLVRVLIDVDGRPSEIDVLRSSGHVRLDDAAIEAVRAALFRPYVADGRARAAYVRVPVEFALRRS